MLELMTAATQPEGYVGLKGELSLVGSPTGQLPNNNVRSTFSAMLDNKTYFAIGGWDSGVANNRILKMDMDTLVVSHAAYDQVSGATRRGIGFSSNGGFMITYGGGGVEAKMAKMRVADGAVSTAPALGWARPGAAYSYYENSFFMYGGENSLLVGALYVPLSGGSSSANLGTLPLATSPKGFVGVTRPRKGGTVLAFIKSVGQPGLISHDILQGKAVYNTLAEGPGDIFSDGCYDPDNDALYFLGGPAAGKVTTLHRYDVSKGKWSNTPLVGSVYEGLNTSIWLTPGIHLQWYSGGIYMWRIDNNSARQIYKIT